MYANLGRFSGKGALGCFRLLETWRGQPLTGPGAPSDKAIARSEGLSLQSELPSPAQELGSQLEREKEGELRAQSFLKSG